MNISIDCLLVGLAAFFASAQMSSAQTKPDKPGKEFHAFLTQLDDAQRTLQNGNAEPFKASWSHADDVTLSGGFGGTIEKGWPSISKRLDWVAVQFAKGTNTIERLVTNQNGSLAYLVQLEHIDFVVPETGKNASRDYHVTMIFRREPTGWRIVHRQADSQITKQAPK